MEIKAGWRVPLLPSTPGHNVFSSLVITSRPVSCHHHSGPFNRHGSIVMSMKHNLAYGAIQSATQAFVARYQCMTLTFLILQPKVHNSSLKVHIFMLHASVYCHWRLRSVGQEVAVRQKWPMVYPLDEFLGYHNSFSSCRMSSSWEHSYKHLKLISHYTNSHLLSKYTSRHCVKNTFCLQRGAV